MFGRLFMLISFIVFETVINIKPKDFCLKENNCNRIFNTKCIKNSCVGNYNYECGLNTCALNRNVCDRFERIHNVLNSNMRILIPDLFIKKYGTFQESINYCETHEYNATDVCNNKENCFYMKVLPMRGNFMRVFEKMDCDCNKSYSYKCGNYYCSVDKAACDEFYKKQSGTVKQCDQ